MKKVLFIILVAIAFVIESKVRLLGIIRLNLTVVFAYYVGLRYGPTRGLFTGAAVGIVADSIAGGIIGPNLLGKAVAGYSAAFLRGGMFIWTPLLGFIGLLVITFLDGAVSFFSAQIFMESPTMISNALIIMFWQGAVNAIAGLLIKPHNED